MLEVTPPDTPEGQKRCLADAVCPGPGSKALPVHNRWAGLIVLALGHPHLLECAQGGKDGATDPDRVLAFRWCDNLDLHGGGRKGRELLGHALTDASEHGGASGEHDVGVEILSDVNVAFHDGLESGVVNATSLLSDQTWLEEHFRATETLAAHCDDVAVRKLVGLLIVRTLGGSLHLCVEIQGDVAQLFFDIAHNL